MGFFYYVIFGWPLFDLAGWRMGDLSRTTGTFINHAHLEYMDRNEKTKVYNTGVNRAIRKRQSVYLSVSRPMYTGTNSKIAIVK